MKAIDLEVKRICEEKLANDAKLSELFKNCYPNTMDTTVKIIGEKDTFVITGDIPQIDLPADKVSGLKEAMRVLQNVEDIAICRLGEADVVRHVIVQRIIKAYEQDEERRTK